MDNACFGLTVEAMFNAHKNTLGFDMCYEAFYDAMEGWAFVEFLALLMCHRINGLLCEAGLIKRFNVKDILYRASTVTQSEVSGAWKVYNMTQPLKDIFEAPMTQSNHSLSDIYHTFWELTLIN